LELQITLLGLGLYTHTCTVITRSSATAEITRDADVGYEPTAYVYNLTSESNVQPTSIKFTYALLIYHY